MLIEYYADEEREQYEKCAMLKKIKDRHVRHNPKSAKKKGKFKYKLGVDDEEDPPTNIS